MKASGELTPFENLQQRLLHHLDAIYPEHDVEVLARKCLSAMGIGEELAAPAAHENLWDERDVACITYANSIVDGDKAPLHSLCEFLDEQLADCISAVHILPFFPYSSDDGFSVIDYMAVDPAVGEWQHIEAISRRYDLMADLVLNHCSASHRWFANFIEGKDPGKDYFFTASPEDDLRQVIRPRTSALLQPVDTALGRRYVWCTFSHDQVDLDFSNPEVLLEFIRIARFYLDRGVRIFRLDAVAFIWKEIGNHCLNLDQTHELVRLLRLLIEHAAPGAIVITETNIPNQENLSYFGNANEAHCIYNFSLPPLLVNALVCGDCRHLKSWLMSMPPAQNGTAYFNFIASHDGIGLRPAEGLLDEEELASFINTMEGFGGQISWRLVDGLAKKPYEVNISLFDALRGSHAGEDQWQMQRFLCAHAIMLALEGIPGIYLHSFLATGNDYERLAATGQNRAINRSQWQKGALDAKLADPHSQHAQVLAGLKKLLKIRRGQKAFHPNAAQFTLHTGDAIFSFWRQSMDQEQTIFCLNNISMEPQEVLLASVNADGGERWRDLVGGEAYHVEDTLALQPYQTVWLSNTD